jgi:hypothetical protein
VHFGGEETAEISGALREAVFLMKQKRDSVLAPMKCVDVCLPRASRGPRGQESAHHEDANLMNLKCHCCNSLLSLSCRIAFCLEKQSGCSRAAGLATPI